MRRLVLLLLILSTHFAWGHARLKTANGIVPRSSSAGLKTGPCGNVARTSNVATYRSGESITVQWEETVNHPGRFEFYFSQANDANWVLLKSVDDMQDNSATLPHQYSTSLTLPNATCTDCTLQMIQVMTENPASPSLYYSCADIRLQSTGGPLPNPGPVPQPCE